MQQLKASWKMRSGEGQPVHLFAISLVYIYNANRKLNIFEKYKKAEINL